MMNHFSFSYFDQLQRLQKNALTVVARGYLHVSLNFLHIQSFHCFQIRVFSLLRLCIIAFT